MKPFNRRAFLAAMPAALALPSLAAESNSSTTEPVIKPMKNSIVYRFSIGDIEAFSISDGTLRFGPPDKMMYPEDQIGRAHV